MLISAVIPESRPEEGYTRRCRVMASVGGHVNLIEVMVAGMTFKVSLLDVASPLLVIKCPGHENSVNPQAIRAEQVLWQIVEAAAVTTVWLPPPPGPRSGRDWNVKANATYPGAIYLDQSKTLNAELVRSGVCWLPRRLDRDTLRDSA